MNIIKLVLIRHGESQWNQENRFTGWVDIDLSDQGRMEARYAGTILKKNNFVFDYGYTSVLKRAIRTLWIILDQLNLMWIPVEKSWNLNERHYGRLQGLNKNTAAEKYGDKQIQEWRRSFNSIPPTINRKDQSRILQDPRYKNIPIDNLPTGESLELTTQRVLPYWKNIILPKIKNKKNIVIVSHGNSIRAIIKLLDQLDASEIFQINIPTGIPIIYEFSEDLHPIQHYYLQ